jgi:hypothetical protein
MRIAAQLSLPFVVSCFLKECFASLASANLRGLLKSVDSSFIGLQQVEHDATKLRHSKDPKKEQIKGLN